MAAQDAVPTPRAAEDVPDAKTGPNAKVGPAAKSQRLGKPQSEPMFDVMHPDVQRPRETFLPITTHALIERLAAPQAWPAGQATAARRFFRYLEYWRRQQHSASLHGLLQTYETFNPDSDLLVTRSFGGAERAEMQKRIVRDVEAMLRQANYVPIDRSEVEFILSKETHYGLDLEVDFDAFEECLVCYRGASNKRDQRRSLRKFMRKEEFDVPIFQRLFLMFKLKPFDQRVREVMAEDHVNRKEAEKTVRNLRAMLPPEVQEHSIYLKLFKNIPRADIEMAFPNTRVKFRLLDKLRLGVTAGGGIGVGLMGAAGKIAVAASNPLAAAGAVAGLGGLAFRQGMKFFNQKQRYMVVMAQNLYFHSLADNRGVLIILSDRAAEEDVKEEMLLYSVLAKEQASHSDLPAIDAAIEQYLAASFGVNVDFDLEDALGRLIADGLVTEDADGTLHTLPPDQAALHLDARWDVFLDHLPDLDLPDTEGYEEESLLPDGVDRPDAPPVAHT